MPDTAEQVDIVRPVITAAAGALHRPDLRETAFPEPQHVLRNIQFVGNLADGAESVWRLVHVHPL
jgi:hypothetical protein